jgi:HSP20 family protein
MTIIKHQPGAYNNFIDELINTSFPATWGKDFPIEWSTVPVNIHENTDSYQIELNAAGRTKEDFNIKIEKDQLTISFEKKEETEKKDYTTIRQEFKYKNFERSFTLDEKINTEAIEAKYENGILKVFLPKKEEVKTAPQQIAVQ